MKKTTAARKLTVRRETLKQLSREALGQAAGGASTDSYRSAICSQGCNSGL